MGSIEAPPFEPIESTPGELPVAEQFGVTSEPTLDEVIARHEGTTFEAGGVEYTVTALRKACDKFMGQLSPAELDAHLTQMSAAQEARQRPRDEETVQAEQSALADRLAQIQARAQAPKVAEALEQQRQQAERRSNGEKEQAARTTRETQSRVHEARAATEKPAEIRSQETVSRPVVESAYNAEQQHQETVQMQLDEALGILPGEKVAIAADPETSAVVFDRHTQTEVVTVEAAPLPLRHIAEDIVDTAQATEIRAVSSLEAVEPAPTLGPDAAVMLERLNMLPVVSESTAESNTLAPVAEIAEVSTEAGTETEDTAPLFEFEAALLDGAEVEADANTEFDDMLAAITEMLDEQDLGEEEYFTEDELALLAAFRNELAALDENGIAELKAVDETPAELPAAAAAAEVFDAAPKDAPLGETVELAAARAPEVPSSVTLPTIQIAERLQTLPDEEQAEAHQMLGTVQEQLQALAAALEAAAALPALDGAETAGADAELTAEAAAAQIIEIKQQLVSSLEQLCQTLGLEYPRAQLVELVEALAQANSDPELLLSGAELHNLGSNKGTHESLHWFLTSIAFLFQKTDWRHRLIGRWTVRIARLLPGASLPELELVPAAA